jgi:hypothetical protein
VISGGEQGRMLFGKLMLMQLERADHGRADQPPRHGIDRIAEHRRWRNSRARWSSSRTTASSSLRWPPACSRSINRRQIIDYLGGYEDYLASQGVN